MERFQQHASLRCSLLMRILYLFEYPTRNGGENSLLSVAPRLLERGVKAWAAAPAHGALSPALRDAGMSLVTWEGQATAGSLAARRENLEKLAQQIAPDLIHANSLSMTRLAGPVCQVLGIPCLGYLRDMMRPTRQSLRDLARATRLIAVSHATRDWYLELGLPPDMMHVVYNGVDLQQYQPRSPDGRLHYELGLPSHVKLVASIGQLGVRKGTDLFLRAAQPTAVETPGRALSADRRTTLNQGRSSLVRAAVARNRRNGTIGRPSPLSRSPFGH